MPHLKKLFFAAFALCVLFNLSSGADLAAERPLFSFYASNVHFLPVVDSAVASARAELKNILLDTLDYKPDIFIAETLDEFEELVGGNIPDWGAAVAIHYRHRIVIKSPAKFNLGKSLYELVKHEYSHLALADRFGIVQPPRWLDEGIAMYIAFEWRWWNSFSLSRAVLFGGLMRLESIEDMNRFDQTAAEIAYAESYMAVKYLLDSYGIESLNILINELARKTPIDQAMMAATGSDLAGFEEEFINYLKGRFNLLTLFIDMSYLWIILAIVVIIGAFLRYLKKRQAYQRWDDEEKLHSTDFDYGDPDNPEQSEDEDKPWA